MQNYSLSSIIIGEDYIIRRLPIINGNIRYDSYTGSPAFTTDSYDFIEYLFSNITNEPLGIKIKNYKQNIDITISINELVAILQTFLATSKDQSIKLLTNEGEV